MEQQQRAPIAQYLREYAALTGMWWPEAGDTHELFAAREVLHNRIGELSAGRLAELRRIDGTVLALVAEHNDAQGWDIAMLRKTAELIEQERQAGDGHAG